MVLCFVRERYITLPQRNAWLVRAKMQFKGDKPHGESAPAHLFQSPVSAISYFASTFFFTTSTFLHDFNFPAPLKHFGTTFTFRQDFFWHDFFYGTTFNFFHRKTEHKNQRGRSPLANRKVFTVTLFGKNYE